MFEEAISFLSSYERRVVFNSFSCCWKMGLKGSQSFEPGFAGTAKIFSATEQFHRLTLKMNFAAKINGYSLTLVALVVHRASSNLPVFNIRASTSKYQLYDAFH
jgi:hypothetical protein